MDALLNCDPDVDSRLRRALGQLIADDLLGSARYTQTTASTNSDALVELPGLVREPPMLPRLYITDQQTAGRGRQGNVWMTDADSLAFSIVYAVDFSVPSSRLLSLAVGVAVAHAIEFQCAPFRMGLKWPNDLCVRSSDASSQTQLLKLGGILIETSANAPGVAVIGVGLNLGEKPKLESPSATIPGSIQSVTSRSVSRVELLPAIIQSLDETIAELASNPTATLQSYRKRCVLTGSHLSLRQNEQVVQGECLGIDDKGALILRVGGQPIAYQSGEVQQIRTSAG